MSEANRKPDEGLVQSIVSPDGVQGIKAEPQSRDVSPAMLPCPFCGSCDLLVGRTNPFVLCNGCDCIVWEKWWNKRALAKEINVSLDGKARPTPG